MKRLWLICLIGVTSVTFAGEESITPPERKKFEVSLETAQLFNYDGNPNLYYFSTQMLSLAWEPFRPLELGPIRMRTQAMSTIFTAAIFGAPETFYLGWGLQIRSIFPIGKSPWALYISGGGGMGYANAHPHHKHDNGLGERFTFILLASTGIRYAINDRWSVWIGANLQHLSNGGLSEISKPKKENIGVDDIGFVIGTGWAF